MIRRLAILILTVAGLSLGGVAWAHWGASTNAGASGRAVATSVNAATLPTAQISAAQTVAVSWPAVTLANSVAVDSYVVKRYDTATLTLQSIGGTCAGTVTATSCVETSVPVGSWRYSVYPKIGTFWVGTESPLTAAVVVTTPTLTLARTYFTSALTTTGTVSGFGVNEAISYRLDGATALTGFPTVVDTTGGAPISSLIIPATTEGTHTVYVIGANGSQASTTIVYDSVAPTVGSSQSPAAGGSTWTTTSPVAVTLTASDATSGVASIKYTTDGSDPTISGTAVVYTTPFNVAATATVRYAATDNAGNTSAVGSRAIKIDTVAPANSLALSSATGAVLSGTTVYYRGIATGSFAITNSVTDAGSGPASSATAALGGTTTGFSHTPSTVTTPAGGPYVSNTFSWTAGAASSPTESVTGADVAGNTTSTALTFTNDSTAPSGGSVDATGLVGTGSRYSTSTTLSVTFGKGTDTGVGLATTGAELWRYAGTLTSGSCSGYGAATLVATDPTSPRADTVTDQACYKYQYLVFDKLGNSTGATYTSSDIKVDSTAPSAPTLASSAATNTYLSANALFYRGSQTTGTVTLTASAADAGSGLLSYTMPPSFGTNWSASSGGSGISTYSWSGSPAAPAAQSVVATDNANLTATTTLTVTNDVTAPTGGSVTYTNGWNTGSTGVVVTFAAGSDGSGSGVATSTGVLQRRSATYTIGTGCAAFAGGWTTIPAATGSPYTDAGVTGMTCVQYQYLVSDNVGNTATFTGSSVVKIPNYYACDTAVNAATPLEYYKLNEASGSTTAADSKSGTPLYPGTYTAVSGWRVGGPCGANNGVTFAAATAGYVGTPLVIANPTTFSEEVWFNTTDTNTRLIGFGQQNNQATSSNYDRHVYLDSAGHLNYGYYTGILSYPHVTTTGTYNDGTWHHVLATESSTNGARLYVDGVFVIGDSTMKTPQSYSGSWRVGTDGMGGWPGITALSNNNYAGSVSNAAFFSTELTAAQVFDHYIAGIVSSTGPVVTTTASIGVEPLSRRPVAPAASPTSAAVHAFRSPDSPGTPTATSPGTPSPLSPATPIPESVPVTEPSGRFVRPPDAPSPSR